MNFRTTSKSDFENLDEMKYSLVHKPTIGRLTYNQMLDKVRTPSIRDGILGERCDTPIKYLYRKRYGFISVKEFIIGGELVHYTMIVNEESNSSYFIHPDLAEKALTVERNQARQSGRDPQSINRKEVAIPNIQLDINSEEFYVW